VTDHDERHAGALPPGPGWSRIPTDSFLGMLTDNQRNSLLGLGSNTTYRPGQTIMREGNPGNAVVIILRGLARVTVHSEDGKEVLLGFRSSGDLVGEMAVMSRRSRSRSATVAAATELLGNFIGAASFVAYLERSPQVASRVSDIIADKLRAASRRRLEYNAYPAEVRLACILAEVALTYGYAEGTAWRIGLEITQADLASLGSVSVRTIEKILRTMEGDGMVARHRRDLIITDLAALQARCRSLGATRPGRDS
jgi:CRP/FNR family transcriptional regulator, cyclic AMP receptor protein